MQVYLSEVQRKKKWRRIRIKIYIGLGLSAALAVSVFYFVNSADIFKITLEISGLQQLSKDNLLSQVYGQLAERFFGKFLGLDNYLSWPSKLVVNEPLVASLSVKKDFWNKKIFLGVEERKPYGIFCNPSDCFWFDKTGVIFGPAPETEGHLILKIISDGDGQSIPLYSQVLSIVDFFKSNNLAVDEYDINNKLQEIRAKLIGGPEVRFSLRFNPDNGLAALKALLDKGDLKNAEYVDLTVENRVYLKNR